MPMSAYSVVPRTLRGYFARMSDYLREIAAPARNYLLESAVLCIPLISNALTELV